MGGGWGGPQSNEIAKTVFIIHRPGASFAASPLVAFWFQNERLFISWFALGKKHVNRMKMLPKDMKYRQRLSPTLGCSVGVFAGKRVLLIRSERASPTIKNLSYSYTIIWKWRKKKKKRHHRCQTDRIDEKSRVQKTNRALGSGDVLTWHLIGRRASCFCGEAENNDLFFLPPTFFPPLYKRSPAKRMKESGNSASSFARSAPPARHRQHQQWRRLAQRNPALVKAADLWGELTYH